MVRVQCKSSRWQMFFKIGVRPATLLKRDSNTGAFLWNLSNFLEHFFYRTSLLWWLLLAVNSVHWKFMLPRKEWYTWMLLLRLVFLNKEYSSEVFLTLLAFPHFSKVAGKSSRPELFCKKDFLENFANGRCFPVNFAKFSRTSFFREHLRWLLLKS